MERVNIQSRFLLPVNFSPAFPCQGSARVTQGLVSGGLLCAAVEGVAPFADTACEQRHGDTVNAKPGNVISFVVKKTITEQIEFQAFLNTGGE